MNPPLHLPFVLGFVLGLWIHSDVIVAQVTDLGPKIVQQLESEVIQCSEKVFNPLPDFLNDFAYLSYLNITYHQTNSKPFLRHCDSSVRLFTNGDLPLLGRSGQHTKITQRTHQ